MRVWKTLLAVCFMCMPGLAMTEKQEDTPIRWVAYYGEGGDAAQLRSFNLVILDETTRMPVKSLLDEGKMVIGYLSLGEVEKHRRYFSKVKEMGLLMEQNPNWPESYFVDIRDPRWAKLLIEEAVPNLLQQGFRGIFMDTLDNPPELERRDPKSMKGMSDAAVSLVKALHQHYPDIVWVQNRGYGLLPETARVVDFVLGESVYADYDFAKKSYQLVEASLYQHQVKLLQEAQRANPHLTVLTLDYWNPEDKEGIQRIYREQRGNGFAPYVATVALDTIMLEPQ